MSKTIFITGASGFVGSNLTQYLGKEYTFTRYNRHDTINIKEDIVIHLAGKAHDLKNTTESTEYYKSNTELTQHIYEAFLESKATVFIYFSSVKAVADKVEGVLTEETIPNPITHYGKSKLLAEQYILSKPAPVNKRVYILRPCPIHGPGNKGNLNLLYKLVSKGIPWPLAAFENKRSFCSIENLNFVIKELIERNDISSGVYNIADDEALSTNELIKVIAQSLGRKPTLWNVPASFIKSFAKLGDCLHLPLNSDWLEKLTQSYEVSNDKLVGQLGKSLPFKIKMAY